MECLVSGCNFLLQTIQHEAFTYQGNQTHYVNINGKAAGKGISKSSGMDCIFMGITLQRPVLQPRHCQWDELSGPETNKYVLNYYQIVAPYAV